MQKVSRMEVPGWFGSPISLVLGWLAIIGIIGSVVLSICSVISINIPLWWVMLQYMVVFFVCKQTLDKIDSNGGKLRHQLIAYSQILRLIAQRNFRASWAGRCRNRSPMHCASFAQLEKILKGYDRRGNFLGLFFTDALHAQRLLMVRSFLKWKNTYMVKMEEWMNVISEMDAMVSMADFRYNHPEANEPELQELPEIIFEGKNLYHPFLGAKAVKNDFTVKDGNYYIITGANMAGKSTLPPFIGRELYLSDGRNACLCRPSEDFPLQNVLQHENYRRPDAWHLLLQCRTDPTGRTIEILQGKRKR